MIHSDPLTSALGEPERASRPRCPPAPRGPAMWGAVRTPREGFYEKYVTTLLSRLRGRTHSGRVSRETWLLQVTSQQLPSPHPLPEGGTSLVQQLGQMTGHYHCLLRSLTGSLRCPECLRVPASLETAVGGGHEQDSDDVQEEAA